MNTRTARGFTLIELLVVIAIIGILSSVVLASLNGARKKGRDARRIADMKQIQLALELYYDSNASEYPLGVGAAGLALLAPTYISTIPLDPQTGASYMYNALTSAATPTSCITSAALCANYVLGANLEDATNSAFTGDVDNINGGTTATIGTVACADGTNGYCVQP